MLDRTEFPALEFARYYHNRWEVELAFDEIKVQLATVTHGTLHTTFRNKTPAGVLQEGYALMTVYNLLRELMAEAADLHGIDPLNISFTGTVEIVRRVMPRPADTPTRASGFIDQLLADIATCVNSRPRRRRKCPRVTKIKMSNWKLRRPQHRSRYHSPEDVIRLSRRYTVSDSGSSWKMATRDLA